MNPRDESDPLDDEVTALLEECCLRIEVEGSSVLDEMCRAHPQHAQALRDGLGFLREHALVEPDDGALPEQLGEFRILRRLGGGGMGVVFLAEQASLQRQVALKLVRPELMFFAGSRARFRREAEAIARLQHPGIVPVFAIGEERGVPYFAMQYVVGASLAAVLVELAGRQPERLTGGDLRDALRRAAGADDVGGEVLAGRWWQVAGELALQISAAVEHAHQRGVLHRDIKPSNVMLGTDGRAQLVDFGLARSQGDAELTMTGTPLGSLAYMSPEQVEGRNDLGVTTDIYALGVTLYELLTLRSPFLGETGTATRARILDGQAVRLGRLHRGLPADLETVCHKAMAADPRDRYPSVLAFAQDLGNALAHKPIAARAAGPWLRIRRFARRHPARAGLVAVLLIAIPTISILSGLHLANREAIARGVETARLARIDALLQTGWMVYLADPARAASSFAEILSAEPEHPLALLGEALLILNGDEPEAIDGYLDRHASALASHPTFGLLRDVPWTDAAAPSGLPQLADIPPHAIDWFVVGGIALQRANLGDEEAFQLALTCLDQAVALAPRAQAVFHFRRTEAAAMRGDAKAVRLDADAIVSLWPDSAPALAIAGHHLTGYATERARELLERSIALDPDLAPTWLYLGVARQVNGDVRTAIAAYREAVRLAPTLPEASGSLARALLIDDDLDGALDAIRSALALEERDPDLYDTAGEIHAARGATDKALAAWAVSQELAPELPWPYFKRGRMRLARGEVEAAIGDLQDASDRGAQYAFIHLTLAEAKSRMNDRPGAITAFERAVRAAPADPDVHVTYLSYLRTLADDAAVAAEERRFASQSGGR